MFDKEIKFDIVKIALSIQLAVFGLIGLDYIGIKIPILRETVIFIYLAILPGTLILKILKVTITTVKNMILSIGISLSILILLSIFENQLFLFLRIKRPFSEGPLTIFIGVFILLLIGICKQRGDYSVSFSIPEYLLSPYIFFILLPFLSMLGGVILRFYDVNLLLLLLLIIISTIPILSLNVKDKIYPLIILSVSLSLIIHTNLSYAGKSLYETFSSGVVANAGVWDSSFPELQNSLVNTLLHPVFSSLMGIDIVWEVHIIGFLIFSLIPLAIYEIHSIFWKKKIAFLSSCLYAFMPFFYTQELIMYAQRTAFTAFFVSIFLLLAFSNDIEYGKRKVLLPMVLFSIASSHYAGGYFFLLILMITVAILSRRRGKKFITLNTCVLYLSILLFWYLYTSQSANFNWIITYGKTIWNNFSMFLNPASISALTNILTKFTFSIDMIKFFYVFIAILAFLGSFSEIMNLLRKRKFADDYYEYTALSVASSIILPFALLPMTMISTRIFSVVLVFTSPFVIKAFMTFLRRLGEENCLKYFSLLLLIFLLFGSGIISNIINLSSGKVSDYSLNRQMDKLQIQRGEGEGKWLLYWSYREDSTITASGWFVRHVNDKVYIDWGFRSHFLIKEGSCSSSIRRYFNVSYGGKILYEDLTNPKKGSLSDVLLGKKRINEGEYIFLEYPNIVENTIITEKGWLKTSDYSNIFNGMNKLYTTGNDIILKEDNALWSPS